MQMHVGIWLRYSKDLDFGFTTAATALRTGLNNYNMFCAAIYRHCDKRIYCAVPSNARLYGCRSVVFYE